MRSNALIIPYSELKKKSQIFKGQKTVLVGGCFDILHFGHLKFLKNAASSGDFLVVALESDEFIVKHKRKQPIHSQEERAEILAALGMVDVVVLLPLFMKDSDYFEMVKKIRPAVVAVTEGDSNLEKKKEQMRQLGGRVEVVTPSISKFSTRKIIELI